MTLAVWTLHSPPMLAQCIFLVLIIIHVRVLVQCHVYYYFVSTTGVFIVQIMAQFYCSHSTFSYMCHVRYQTVSMSFTFALFATFEWRCTVCACLLFSYWNWHYIVYHTNVSHHTHISCSPGDADTEHFQNTWASTGVKIGSAWLCFIVYLWTLLAPLVLGSCRDFDYAD